MTSLIMKFFKVITFIIFICPVSIAFAAVSGFVDNKDITQRIAHGIAFNENGTKMLISGSSQNKVFEFDLTVISRGEIEIIFAFVKFFAIVFGENLFIRKP